MTLFQKLKIKLFGKERWRVIISKRDSGVFHTAFVTRGDIYTRYGSPSGYKTHNGEDTTLLSINQITVYRKVN